MSSVVFKLRFLLFIYLFLNKNKGSNDSNYSGPSSAGDISYEESEKNRKSNLIGGGSSTAQAGLNSGATTAANRNSNKTNTPQNKQQQQQRIQDAKHELELCRVNKF